MGKNHRTRKEDKIKRRQSRRDHVEHEKRTRTCGCPPHEDHAPDCPAGQVEAAPAAAAEPAAAVEPAAAAEPAEPSAKVEPLAKEEPIPFDEVDRDNVL